jgi:16S rRNA (guanine966-N2)-methyltransferase
MLAGNPARTTVAKRTRADAARKSAGLRNELRIIGGEWRSRRVQFPPLPQLRPTPDRVRETLFNWLAPLIEGARCVDLFAGSGALGFEAASRGAAAVVLVEREPRVCAALTANAERLGGGRLEVICDDAFAYLARPGGRIDVAFVDPPYGEGLAARACSALASSGRLAPGARVYLESDAQEGPPALPAGWALLRSGRAGRVGYHLVMATPPRADARD